ncbi:hypothetical protein [Sphingomonas sp.]|uniref:hypothetical protein n=1 Tax=Sphingomonas sp. TaxID=28214 RepID=UPI003B3A927D
MPVIAPSSLDRALHHLDHFLGGALTRLGEAKVQSSQAQLAIGQAQAEFLKRNVITPINAFISRHEAAKDGIAAALDVSAVIAGGVALAALAAGASTVLVGVGLALGVLGGLAGLALLWQDAKHLWFVLNGNEAGKLALEHDPKYMWIEAVGPLLALPDLAMSGRAALRELASASTQAGRAAQLTGSAERLAGNEAREFRQMIADPEQSAAFVMAARQQSELRALQYKRLQAITQRINRDLMLKRNAVLAYSGAAYGAVMYGLQPPELAQRLLQGDPGHAGSTAPAQDPYALLAPGGSNGPAGHMQVTAVVATRGSRSR